MTIIAVFVAFAVFYLGVGAYAASRFTRINPDRIEGTATPGTFGLGYRDVRFPARGDGVQIAAWYIPRAGSTRAVIMVHGRNSSKQTAVSGSFVNLAVALNKAGFSVLMIDLRGHGESDGARCSFGLRERQDVLGAVDWLLGQGFEAGSIGALGISLGAGAVIGAAFEDSSIGLLVLESSFADLTSLVESNWKKETGLPRIFLPGVFFMSRVLYGYGASKVRPREEIAGITPRPVLIIHSTVDERVDISHAEAFKEVLPYAQTWYVEGCEHAEIYRYLPHEYEERVISFISDNLKPNT